MVLKKKSGYEKGPNVQIPDDAWSLMGFFPSSTDFNL